MSRLDDIVPLIAGGPGESFGFHSGVLEAFDPATGTNTVTVAGGTLSNLPVLNADAVTLEAGDTVAVMKVRSSYFVLGKITSGAAGSGLPVGAMLMTPVAAAPAGFLLCDGATYDTADYPKLADYLTGGAPGPTFAVPDVTDRFPLGAGARAPLAQGGEETHTLTAAEMPVHSHYLGGHTWAWGPAGTVHIPVDAVAGPGGGNNLHTVQGSWNYSANAGSGQPHNNMPPYTALNFIIKF